MESMKIESRNESYVMISFFPFKQNKFIVRKRERLFTFKSIKNVF